MDALNSRKPDHAIESIFYERWSPRALDPNVAVPDAVLMQCFEAARWAPSSHNLQPWRFVYAKRGHARFPAFVDLLQDRAKEWAQHCSALIFIVTKATMVEDGKVVPSRTHTLEAGAAFENFALQASRLGWGVHCMEGFKRDLAPKVLGVPEGFHVQCAVAIGKRTDDKSRLPPHYAKIEFAKGRAPLSALLMEGEFKPELADLPGSH